jgi:RHS repeat-associated protein
MKKYIIIFILLLFAGTGLTAQTFSDDNFVYTASPKKAVQSSDLSKLTKDEINQNVTYFDGLGRPIQSIAINQGGDGQDIITPMDYDGFGRQQKEYLPYTVSNGGTTYPRIDPTEAINATTGFYNKPKYDNTANPFSQKNYENSPLNRVLKQAAPGNPWAMGSGHEIKLDYQTNTSGDAVKLYRVTTSWQPGQGLYEIGYPEEASYAENELYKTVTYDENSGANPSESSGATVEFKNKEGQVVLKRTYDGGVKHDTYYVYDIYGNLTYVIPPKADVSVTPTVLNDLCYQYKYDARNRLVEKKLPGKQWELILYDNLDRVVGTGPAFSPFSDVTSPGWLVTKYDAFNRPVITGWRPAATVTSANRKTLQDALDVLTTNFNETKITTATNTTVNGVDFRYTNVAWPISAYHILTVNYFDDYNYPGAPTIPTTVQSQAVYYNTKVKPKGLPTGSWTRILETSTTYRNEQVYTFYDSKARPLRNRVQNFLGGYTIVDNNYDFDGTITKTTAYHKRVVSSPELKTIDVFTYSAQDRLLTQTHQINGGAIELIANNIYDELGQLISKRVGNNIQKIDYTYNIRGWLTSINEVSALAKTEDPKDLFAFKINYNSATSGIANVKALYNGNIAETYWATNSDAGIIRAYGYRYDNLNRLKDAVFKNGTTLANTYNETLTYDKNGNIITLKRNGLNGNGTVLIDDLVYNYASGNTANVLMKVVDKTTNIEGFKDSPANTVDDYSYDANGNMIKDNNKNITAIVYNHLNLPTKITFAATGNIVYLYNATGQKVQKIVSQTGKPAITTDYLGGFQYSNTILKFFSTSEGYIEPVGSSYKYVYQYKDHLGNVRLSYDKNLVIQEENNYYPFGLKHVGYNGNTPSTNDALKYKYNGQELQEELGLNMTAMDYRQYDNALGRFNSIDALSEMSYSTSPFVFAYNNPIFWADPSGLLSQGFIDSLWKNSANNASTIWTNDGSGNFDKAGGSGFVNKEGEYHENTESLPEVTIVRGIGDSRNGDRIRGSAYLNGKYYEHWRDNQNSKKWDDFQEGLDWLGTVPGIGEPVDLLNAGISLTRGNYQQASLGLAAAIPVLGWAATAAKIQKHHIIPKAVYKEFAGDLAGLMKRDGMKNLMLLPVPYHLGSHKAYSNYVRNEINTLRKEGLISPGSIEALQENLKGIINEGLENFHKTGENLNTYFKQF